MIKRHVSIIEEDIVNLSYSFLKDNSYKYNSSTFIKGNSICQ